MQETVYCIFTRLLEKLKTGANISEPKLQQQTNQISSWWKPSSHKNPLGKNGRLGTAVYSSAGQYESVLSPSLCCMR